MEKLRPKFRSSVVRRFVVSLLACPLVRFGGVSLCSFGFFYRVKMRVVRNYLSRFLMAVVASILALTPETSIPHASHQFLFSVQLCRHVQRKLHTNPLMWVLAEKLFDSRWLLLLRCRLLLSPISLIFGRNGCLPFSCNFNRLH